VRCFDEDTVIADWPASVERPPRCPQCGGLLRPDVVWFGEALPGPVWTAAVAASRAADVFFAIGTSALVQPAAGLPIIAQRQGSALVEINPEATPLTAYADYALHGAAGTILPRLVAAVWPNRPTFHK
jgi:NAD-dependent deacetylase